MKRFVIICVLLPARLCGAGRRGARSGGSPDGGIFTPLTAPAVR